MEIASLQNLNLKTLKEKAMSKVIELVDAIEGKALRFEKAAYRLAVKGLAYTAATSIIGGTLYTGAKEIVKQGQELIRENVDTE